MTALPTARSEDSTVPDEAARLQHEIARQAAVIRGFEVELAAERRRLAQATTDLEDFVHRLARAEAQIEELRRTVALGEELRPTGLAGWWHARQKRTGPTPPPPPPPYAKVPGVEFTYFLNTSPYRIFREPAFTLKGWGFPRSGEPVTALRARVDDAEFFGTYGLEEPSVIAHFGPQPNNPKPGFKIILQTPPGRHWLSLEAQVAGGEWRSFLGTPIWVQHDRR